MPAAAVFVGLISVGVEEPTVMVIALLPDTAELSVHVILPGVETDKELQVTPDTDTLPLCRLFQLNALAEGEALLVVVPGKFTTMVPLEGIAVDVIKEIVCLAVIGTMRVSTPFMAAVPVVCPK